MKNLLISTICIFALVTTACSKSGDSGGGSSAQPANSQQTVNPNLLNPNTGKHVAVTKAILGRWKPTAIVTTNGITVPLTAVRSQGEPEYYEVTPTEFIVGAIDKTGSFYTLSIDYHVDGDTLVMHNQSHLKMPNQRIISQTNDTLVWQTMCQGCTLAGLVLKKLPNQF